MAKDVEYIQLNPLIEVLTSWFIVHNVEPTRARILAELWYILHCERNKVNV